MKKIIIVLILSMFSINSTQAFDLKDLNRVFDKSYKCKGDKKCKKKERLKAVARVAAVAVAATVITKMIIKHRSKKLEDEKQVAEEYKKQHKTLPEQAYAAEYVTNALPGTVVQPGKEIVIKSDILVVPGVKQKSTLIEERLAIYDNEDNTKELKSLTKAVNKSTKKAGRYENEFSFTLPEGIPQGVYPVKTELLLDGKVVDSSETGLQLVLYIDNQGKWMYALASL
jgi:hypothetical protein